MGADDAETRRAHPSFRRTACPGLDPGPEASAGGRSQVTAEFLRESRALLDQPPSAAPGLWERAAVLLARQALEEALDRFWASRSPDLRQASMRAQLLCLGVLMNNERDAADVDQLWGVLSDTCHFDACALTPGASEVRVWLDETARLCVILERRAGSLSNGSDAPQAAP